MIRPLIIGDTEASDLYRRLLKHSGLFSEPVCIVPSQSEVDLLAAFKEHRPDALLVVSHVEEFFDWVTDFIRMQVPVYFTGQTIMTEQQNTTIGKLLDESSSVFFPELLEINHPMLEDFIALQRSQLKFGYQRSVSGKMAIRRVLFEALCLLIRLSAMPVRKMDVNTRQGNSFIVDISLLDHSEGKIEIVVGKEPLHRISLSSDFGNFVFDLHEGTVENQFGNIFPFEPWNEEKMISITLQKFGMAIVNRDQFTVDFNRYLLVFNMIRRLELFLSL